MQNLALAMSSLFQAALRHAQQDEDDREALDTIARQFSALYVGVGCAEDLSACDKLDSLDVVFDELDRN